MTKKNGNHSACFEFSVSEIIHLDCFEFQVLLMIQMERKIKFYFHFKTLSSILIKNPFEVFRFLSFKCNERRFKMQPRGRVALSCLYSLKPDMKIAASLSRQIRIKVSLFLLYCNGSNYKYLQFRIQFELDQVVYLMCKQNG